MPFGISRRQSRRHRQPVAACKAMQVPPARLHPPFSRRDDRSTGVEELVSGTSGKAARTRFRPSRIIVRSSGWLEFPNRSQGGSMVVPGFRLIRRATSRAVAALPAASGCPKSGGTPCVAQNRGSLSYTPHRSEKCSCRKFAGPYGSRNRGEFECERLQFGHVFKEAVALIDEKARHGFKLKRALSSRWTPHAAPPRNSSTAVDVHDLKKRKKYSIGAIPQWYAICHGFSFFLSAKVLTLFFAILQK